MERGEGFRRRREIERDTDEYHYLERESRWKQSLESGERADDSPEKRLSDVIIKVRIREILDTLERQERESIRDLTDEDRTEILRRAREQYPVRECANSDTSRIEQTTDTKEETFHLDTLEKFHDALEHHPEIRFRTRFSGAYQEAREFYEQESDEQPSLVRELDHLETRRLYEEVHDGLPTVEIESMIDVERLLQKYPSERERKNFSDQYQTTKIYFEVRENSTKLQKELADEYGISQQRVSDYQRGVETTLISNLRQREEREIINEWVSTDLQTHLEMKEKTEMHIQEGTELSSETSIHRIESSKVKEHLEGCFEMQSVNGFIEGIKEVCQELDASEARIGYIDLLMLSKDSERLSNIAETLRMNREAIEVTV